MFRRCGAVIENRRGERRSLSVTAVTAGWYSRFEGVCSHVWMVYETITLVENWLTGVSECDRRFNDRSYSGTCGLVAMRISLTALTIVSGRSLGISWPLSGTIICFPFVER